jgi:peptidoglycan/LPS O-acetylase OafA/YrhL
VPEAAPATAAPPPQNRLPAIDGLRGIAILCVILFHYRHALLPGGFVGVDLFFVISGYVITRSLAAEIDRSGRVSLAGFYARRARRILPALAVLLIVVLLYSALAGRLLPAEVQAGVAAATSTYNWFLASGWPRTSWFVHVWSLSVEEQFYLLWPLAFAVSAKRGRVGPLTIALATLIAISAAWSTILGLQGAPWQRIYFGSDTRAQAILAGCLLALVGKSVPQVWLKYWPVPIASFAALALTLDNHDPSLGLWGLAATTLVCAWIVASAAEARDGPLVRLLSVAPLQWAGLRSYSLFLWHLPVALALSALDPRFWLLPAILVAALFSELSYRWIERPLMHRARPGSG